MRFNYVLVKSQKAATVELKVHFLMVQTKILNSWQILSKLRRLPPKKNLTSLELRFFSKKIKTFPR